MTSRNAAVLQRKSSKYEARIDVRVAEKYDIKALVGKVRVRVMVITPVFHRGYKKSIILLTSRENFEIS